MDGRGSQPGYQSADGRGASRPVRGRSLHDVLHDPGTGIAQQAVIPLDASRVVLIAHAILTALAGGVVHGYITPHTILLTDDGTALLVGDRVAPGATPANDLFALGLALFEAVEGRAPHPAEPLPPMTKAGVLAPLIEALTRREPEARPTAAEALEVLKAALAAPPAADVTETRTLPRVGDEPESGNGGGGAGASGSTDADSRASAGDGTGTDSGADAASRTGAAGRASDETSLLPPVPDEPVEAAGPGAPLGPVGAAGSAPWGGSTVPPRSPISPVFAEHSAPPDYADFGYAPYEPYPPSSKRKPMIIGVAAVVIIGGIALGVTQPWHRTDNSSSTVPGIPTATTSAPITPAAATPSTSATPTPSPTVSNPTALVSMSLCLDAASGPGGIQSGAKVSAGACHGSPNQAWQIHTDGTIHSMADPNLCLDAAAPTGKVLNAAQVSAWTCHGGPNQDWVWNANGTVSPVANTALCLDAAGPLPIKPGANVTAWTCNNGANEHWAKQ